jgi:hypothetical protein
VLSLIDFGQTLHFDGSASACPEIPLLAFRRRSIPQVNTPDDTPRQCPEAAASSAPKHQSFSLTSSQPRPRREQVAWGALIIGIFLFFVSGLLLCFCPEFHVAIAVCGIIATWLGSRAQRTAGLMMLAVAVVFGGLGYQQERRAAERVRRAMELRVEPPPQ